MQDNPVSESQEGSNREDHLIAQFSETLLKEIWSRKRDELLEYGLASGSLKMLAEIDPSLKRSYESSEKQGALTPDFRLAARKHLKNWSQLSRAYAAHVLVALIHIPLVGRNSYPVWLNLLFLRAWRKELNLPENACPDEKTLCEALADSGLAEKLFHEEFEPQFRYVCAIGILSTRETGVDAAARSLAELQLPEGPFDTPARMFAAERSFILPWLRTRNKLLASYRILRKLCAEFEPTPAFAKAASLSASKLAQQPDDFFEKLLADARAGLIALLPPPFQLAENLTLLEAISPPLKEVDLAKAREELRRIDAGELQPENSWLLQWVFPGLRRELEFSYEDADKLEACIGSPFPFSLTFYGGLVQGRYQLHETLGAASNSRNPTAFNPAGKADVCPQTDNPDTGANLVADLPEPRLNQPDNEEQAAPLRSASSLDSQTNQASETDNSGRGRAEVETGTPGEPKSATRHQSLFTSTHPYPGDSQASSESVNPLKEIYEPIEPFTEEDRPKVIYRPTERGNATLGEPPAEAMWPCPDEESSQSSSESVNPLEEIYEPIEAFTEKDRPKVIYRPTERGSRTADTESAKSPETPRNAEKETEASDADVGRKTDGEPLGPQKPVGWPEADAPKDAECAGHQIGFAKFRPTISAARMQEMGNLGGLEDFLSGAGRTAPTRDPEDFEREDGSPRARTHTRAELQAAIESALLAPDEEQRQLPQAGEIESVYSQLLQLRDSAALYWLAIAFDDASPLPVWLARLLYYSLRLDYANMEDELQIRELTQEALRSHQDLDERQSLLLLTALLRPALLLPARAMGTIFSTLANRLQVYGLQSLLRELGTFVSREKPLDEAILTGKTPEQLKAIVHARLEDKTRDLLKRMENPSFTFVPALKLCTILFGENGELGLLLRECLAGQSKRAKDYVKTRLEAKNRGATVDAILDRIRGLRYHKSLDGQARQKLITHIEQAHDLLIEWIGYYSKKGGEAEPSYQEESFQEICAKIESDRLNGSPEGCWLQEQLEALRDYHAPENPENASAKLELWPARLASARLEALPHLNPAKFLAELRLQDYNDPARIAASLRAHLARGHISAVRRFFELHPDLRGVAPDRSFYHSTLPLLGRCGNFSLERLEEASRDFWDRQYEGSLSETLEYINDCIFRGAIRDSQSLRANDTLNQIRMEAGAESDKPLAIRRLDDLRRQLRQWDDAILQEITARLESLDAESARPGVGEYLRKLREEVDATRLYSVAWNRIATLEDCLVSGATPVFESRQKQRKAAAGDFYNKLRAGEIREDPKLSEEWRDALELRRRDYGPGKSLAALTRLLRWFGFVLERDVRPEHVYSSGAPVFWQMDRYRMQIKSPLPLWGSQSGGNHIIAFGWNKVTPHEINNLMTSGYIRENNSVVIICFCRLEWRDRLQIIRDSSNWRTFPLIIDSNIFNYMASQDAQERSRILFELTLAGANYNPFITAASGFVPEEMFYGRSSEKSNIIRKDGACVVYGGRQLGKSALLQQIYADYECNRNEVVIYIILGKNESSLLDKLLIECIHRGIVNMNTTKKTFSRNIEAWLNEDSTRRLLVLLDECDNALEQDAGRDFDEVWTLDNLMGATRRNFKVVFTGLHSVQRFSHRPNLPFYHHITPVCIGPLDNEAAHDLMTEPMATLGIEFESTQLVQMALNYCNYQPRLIQMFCSELLDAIQRNPAREPCMTIDKSNILAVYDSQNLKKKIQECFSMTLDLDPRYFVIAYVMALNSDKGSPITELWNDLKAAWPDAFQKCDLETLRSLLHEMEGLGLVICLSGAYRLRTPNIIELLGGEDNIFLELEQKRNAPFIPPNDPGQLRIQKANMFVATQYNILADKASRLYWVSGSASLGLGSVPDALETIASANASGKQIPCVRISGMTVKEAKASLKRAYERVKSGGLIVWISSREFPFMEEFMKEAQEWLSILRSDKKFVKIVCLVWPGELFNFIRNGLREEYGSLELRLLPWSLTGLEDRCRELALPVARALDVLQHTGGWHSLVEEELNDRSSDRQTLRDEVAGIFSEIGGLGEIVSEFKALGVKVSVDDLEVLRPAGMEEEHFWHCLELLRSLHLVREQDNMLFLDDCAFAEAEA